MSSLLLALRVTAISMPVIFAVMVALWAMIVILRALFPCRDEDQGD